MSRTPARFTQADIAAIAPHAKQRLGHWSHDSQLIGDVYFVQSAAGAIKIGFSTDLKHRLRDLQVASGERLTLIGKVSGTYSHESSLHRHFRHLHLHGEWFSPGKDLLDFIHAEATK